MRIGGSSEAPYSGITNCFWRGCYFKPIGRRAGEGTSNGTALPSVRSLQHQQGLEDVMLDSPLPSKVPAGGAPLAGPVWGPSMRGAQLVKLP